MRTRSSRPSISDAVALALLSLALLGSTATNTMTPTANVVANCNLTRSAQNALGAYDPVVVNRTTDLKVAIGVLSLACTRGAPGVTISIDTGNNWDGTYRYMKRGSALLKYVLYSDPSYSTPWDLTHLYTYTSTSMAAATLTVYTDVPAGQDVPSNANNYTDTVTATVNF